MKYLIALFLSLINPWIWKLFSYNFLYGLLILILTLTILKVISYSFRPPFLWIAIFLFLSLSAFFFKGVDPGLFRPDPVEIYHINQSRQYYPKIISPLFQNKPLLALSKITDNFFTSIDPNLYFFAGHPRERPGASEFSKINFLFIPLLILGLVRFIRNPVKSGIYLGIFLNMLSLISDTRGLTGFSLMFPVIFSLTTMGIKK